MTSSERERRIAAVARRRYESEAGYQWEAASQVARVCYCEEAAADLDAADEAVPMVGEEWAKDQVAYALGRGGGVMSRRPSDRERAERAEAAATDFAKVLAVVAQDERGARLAARAILARHPSFSGEEGTGE